MAMVMNFSPPDERDQIGDVPKQQFSHFTHRHPLELSQMHEEDKAVCSGCELDISGPAYICAKTNCNFIIHDLCFDLTRQIRHHSHRKHPLALLSTPPYSDLEFTCDACGDSGHGFTYHCVSCKFDLHVKCAALPEIENREDHQHPLILQYDYPEKIDKFVCYLCSDPIQKGCWSYCCLGCDCGAHLECAGTSNGSSISV